jgi:hypothetical protein
MNRSRSGIARKPARIGHRRGGERPRVEIGLGRWRQRHALRQLEHHESVERWVAERLQIEGEGIVAGLARHVGPREMRRRTDRGEEIADGGEVAHLLARHQDGRRHPLPYGNLLRCRQFLVETPFHGQSGVEILDHQAVLDLAGLFERSYEFVAAINHVGPKAYYGPRVRSCLALGRVVS